MANWTIHTPPDAERGAAGADRFIAVKDGLRPFALLFGPFWFLAKRLWLGALGVLIVEALLIGLGLWLDLPQAARGTLEGLFQVLLGLEASSIQRWTLRRRGWREAGVVCAHGRAEADMRAASLLEDDMTRFSAAPPPAPGRGAGPPRSYPAAPASPSVLGLFPEARPR